MNFFCFITDPILRPCEPSPCGPNSICRELNGQAICSCVQGYIGNPPSCRPECIQSADCSPSLACINRKCQDPCPGSCASNAICQVKNHNPICFCPPRYTGSPFTHCYGKYFFLFHLHLKQKIILSKYYIFYSYCSSTSRRTTQQSMRHVTVRT